MKVYQKVQVYHCMNSVSLYVQLITVCTVYSSKDFTRSAAVLADSSLIYHIRHSVVNYYVNNGQRPGDNSFSTTRTSYKYV